MNYFTGKLARQPHSDLGVFFSQRPNRFDKRPLGQRMGKPDAQEAVRFGVARRKRFQRLRPLQQISRLLVPGSPASSGAAAPERWAATQHPMQPPAFALAG